MYLNDKQEVEDGKRDNNTNVCAAVPNWVLGSCISFDILGVDVFLLLS